MHLTTAQRATLLANVIANSDTAQARTDGNLELLAALYNTVASPAFWVWRTAVTKSELVQSVSVDATTFTWVGNGFITRSVGEQTAWRELFNGENSVNPSLANVRQAFADIFSGIGNAAANRTHLLAVGRRLSSRFERVFATGTGSIATPGMMVLEGQIDYTEFQGL
jgi:hypothetical protein